MRPHSFLTFCCLTPTLSCDVALLTKELSLFLTCPLHLVISKHFMTSPSQLFLPWFWAWLLSTSTLLTWAISWKESFPDSVFQGFALFSCSLNPNYLYFPLPLTWLPVFDVRDLSCHSLCKMNLAFSGVTYILWLLLTCTWEANNCPDFRETEQAGLPIGYKHSHIKCMFVRKSCQRLKIYNVCFFPKIHGILKCSNNQFKKKSQRQTLPIFPLSVFTHLSPMSDKQSQHSKSNINRLYASMLMQV